MGIRAFEEPVIIEETARKLAAKWPRYCRAYGQLYPNDLFVMANDPLVAENRSFVMEIWIILPGIGGLKTHEGF